MCKGSAANPYSIEPADEAAIPHTIILRVPILELSIAAGILDTKAVKADVPYIVPTVKGSAPSSTAA
uniref:Uncharacterized protein n=1 Tax=Caldiarchaeum subterraneum TaxID=311458 RepID=E6N318_CALS0|nr:hypothetical protein HGMM_F16D08C12 [Candidatus Caldarchaeum subterraneum]